MKEDIRDLNDLLFLLTEFYSIVREDETIGYIFNDVAKVNWEQHLPIIANFWDSILFGSTAYKGNPMLQHILLSKKTPMTALHFDRWLEIWRETIDRLFEGEKAEEAKTRAKSIAGLMLYKIEHGI